MRLRNSAAASLQRPYRFSIRRDAFVYLNRCRARRLRTPGKTCRSIVLKA